MRLLRQAHEFEYRDGDGVDRLGQADLWSSSGGDRAVLVLRGVQGSVPVPEPDTEDERPALLDATPDALPRLRDNGRRALRELEGSLLPFLVPRARLNVLVLHRRRGGDPAGKMRALVLS